MISTQNTQPIKDALIVAAGMGTRLQDYGPSKPLVKFNGMPLIEYAMHAAAQAGVNRFVIVTGYLANQLSDFVYKVAAQNGWELETIDNPDYQKSNGLSVLAAESALPGPFFLAMCDHLVSSEIYQRLSAADIADDQVALGLDYQLQNPNVDLNDVTRVFTQKTSTALIRKIGKHLGVFNAFDTGIFRAGPALFQALRTSAKASGNNNSSISAAMQLLASSNNAVGVDIGDAFWIDVDSPAMYQRAKRCVDQTDFKLDDVNSETTRYQPAIKQIA